jgi:hypothetical protein
LENIPCSNDLTGRRLAGVDLRLRIVALSRRDGLLASERFLFHGHFWFLQFYLTALRIPLEQVESQTRSLTPTIVKLLKTNDHVKIFWQSVKTICAQRLYEG